MLFEYSFYKKTQIQTVSKENLLKTISYQKKLLVKIWWNWHKRGPDEMHIWEQNVEIFAWKKVT